MDTAGHSRRNERPNNVGSENVELPWTLRHRSAPNEQNEQSSEVLPDGHIKKAAGTFANNVGSASTRNIDHPPTTP